MKSIKYLLVIAIILITVTSCSSNAGEEQVILSNELLYFEPADGTKPDKIDNIFIFSKQLEEEVIVTLNEKDFIIMDDLIEALSEIELKKLSKKDKNILFETKQVIYKLKPTDSTNHTGTSKIPQKIAEEIYIFSTGEIVFIGPKTTGDIIPKQLFYINTEDARDKIESIISLIEYANTIKNP